MIKKIILAIFICIMFLTGCASTAEVRANVEEDRQEDCIEPGSFFPEGEQRYILVDKTAQEINGCTHYLCVYADKYTGVMYLVTDDIAYAGYYINSWTMLTDAEGKPMIYKFTKLESDTPKYK